MELGPKLGQKLVEGQFVERTNRFLARVIVAGREVGVHVSNSGRMLELFTPGARVLLRPVKGNHRKTCYDLALVDLDGTLVSADARLPNALVAEAITGGRIPPLSGYSELIREAGFGESRLDIMLNGAQGRCYVEAKSVTLIESGVGLFPDSPTVRGAQTPAISGAGRRARPPRGCGVRGPTSGRGGLFHQRPGRPGAGGHLPERVRRWRGGLRLHLPGHRTVCAPGPVPAHCSIPRCLALTHVPGTLPSRLISHRTHRTHRTHRQ